MTTRTSPSLGEQTRLTVSGYSAVFVDLPRSFQDDIVAHTEFCEA